jgi:hypothetical protein
MVLDQHLLWSGSGSDRFDDRELSFRIHLAFDAKLPLHRHWASARKLFRGLARELCANDQGLLSSYRSGEVMAPCALKEVLEGDL